MRTTLAIGLATFFATPVAAQYTNCTTSGPFVNCMDSDGTITNCNRVGPTVNCQSMGGPARSNSYERPTADTNAANGIVSMFRGIKAARARTRAMSALRAGDCGLARIEALDSGDMGFAQQVEASCSGR